MGKLRCFEIILSDDKTVFHPGELVLGKVIVELKEDTKMRSLSIFMRGVAKVHWTEYRSSSSGSETKFYKDEYEYFFKQQDLFGGGECCHCCNLIIVISGRVISSSIDKNHPCLR